MYLKSIEIQGFKSFAQKTSLNFNTGVTAIVGPNGSGKSNISDAVRWVLGEQKARQLRGAAMQDVIFAGTELRKPQGFASVCIVLDNSDHAIPLDYEEISVSRKLFRSGESEYRLNSQQVRLKDIQELFYDLGIGRDGYSIISQGRVEAILSSRDEDRRSIFDEAAGIVRSKMRKQAALKKLESEGASLVRINDIVGELEGRIGPLREQAVTARKYLELKEEQKRLDINLFIRDTGVLLNSLEKTKNDLNTAREQFNESNEEKNRLRQLESELAERLDELAEAYNRSSSEMSRAELLKQNLMGQIDVLRIEIRSEEAERDRLHAELKSAADSADAARSEAALQLKSIDALISSLELVKKDPACGSEPDILPDIDGLLDRLQGFRSKLSQVPGVEGAKAVEPVGVHRSGDGREQSEAGAVGAREQSGTGAGGAREQSGTGAGGGREQSEAGAVGTREQSGAGAGDAREQSGAGAGDIREQSLAATAGAGGSGPSADDIDKGCDEEAGSGDTGMQMPDWLADIRSRRSELEQLTEKELRCNAWLAHSTEEYNRLTGSLKELRGEYSLKQQTWSDINARYESLRNIAERYEGFGDSVKAVMRKKETIQGIHGVVAELIRTKKAYEKAIETALGGRIQNIVTDDEYCAKECVEFLRRTKQGRATFLPLSAVRYKRQKEYGSALGERGVIGLAVGLVEFAEEYRELAGYLLGNVLVVDNIDNAIAIAGKYRYTLRIVTPDGDLLSPGGAISGGSYKNNSSLMSRSRELEELALHRSDAGAALEEAALRIREAEDSAGEKAAEIDAITEELKGLAEEKQRLSYLVMSDMRVKLSELSQSTGYAGESTGRIMSELEGLSSREAAARERIDVSSELIEAKEREIVRRNEDIAHVESQLGIISEELSRWGAEREELSASRSSYYKRREELDEEVLGLQKELVRLEGIVERDQQKLDNVTGYIWDEYALSLSSAQEYYDEELGAPARIRPRLNRVKNEIKALGNVNVNAVEEYKEVSERYEFLSAQQKDLQESRTAIEGIIKELDEDMRKRFREKFAAIRELFSSTYKELFGGGYADLKLVYDNHGAAGGESDSESGSKESAVDELSAGIAIEAQPPGKRLKSLLQLSGGEKALTAIALLFAIQKLRPSPFCLLDEIEASLDDINVARFASYLRNISSRTQFIVITHRRGTMEAADRLYGVTMQERGVSKLISVDLISDSLE